MTMISMTPRALREQQTFRVLLNAMARPGTIERIFPHENGGEFAAVASVVEALLDHEVTFAVLPDRVDLIDLVLRQTGSRVAPIDEAGYIVCNVATLAEALDHANDGTLEYPDRGATVICSVADVGDDGSLALRGPGIRDVTYLRVEGLTDEALALFAECNSQPPLGVDIVFVTADGRTTSLTRYTRVVKETI